MRELSLEEGAAIARMKRVSFRPLALALGGITAISAALAWVVTEPVWASPSAAARSSNGASERLSKDVSVLASMERDIDHPVGLEATHEWIREQLAPLGLSVDDQVFEVRGIPVANVIAHAGPEAGARVVVGAHYDTCGARPGADDNASGVAGLIEIARRLSQAQPSGRIDLVFYTLEEPPYFATEKMGSLVHAMSLRKTDVDVKAMVALEMIGTFSDAPGSQGFPSSLIGMLYPDKGDFIAIVGDLDQISLARSTKRAMLGASSLPVRSINAPRSLVGIDFSDHRSYWAAGYPAVMITDTAFFRNSRYHTEADTPDHLDYARMSDVVDGVEAAVRELASRS